MECHSLLQFFRFDHLHEPMRYTSQKFYLMAHELDIMLPDNSEKDAALRRLLESKDSAIRSHLFLSADGR